MVKSNHKYRVSIYLGKELYEKLDELSKKLECSVSTMTRYLLIDGLEETMPVLEEMFSDKGLYGVLKNVERQ